MKAEEGKLNPSKRLEGDVVQLLGSGREPNVLERTAKESDSLVGELS